MSSGWARLACVGLALATLAGGCGANGHPGKPPPPPGSDMAMPPPPPPEDDLGVVLPPDDMAMATPPLMRFAVLGDFGVDDANEAAVARLIKAWAPDFIVSTGDNNYPNGERDTIDRNIGKYYGDFIGGYTGQFGKGSASNRFWPCLGNHDWYSMEGAQPYLDYFPALPGKRRYYDVVIGPLHFYSIDSDRHEPDGTDVGSTQAQWLRGALAQSTSCWDIVFFHHPGIGSGPPEFIEPEMQWPFKQWGAELVLTGHQHQYERMSLDGLLYVVDGLGGALNRFEFPGMQPGSQRRYNADFGALFVEVYPERLRFEFQNTQGQVIDRFELPAACSAQPD
jgi:tartrate-resistant acid phosphatase type 5